MKPLALLLLLATTAVAGCATNGEFGFAGHPLDCAIGVGHSDCAPGTPGHARFAREGSTGLRDAAAILSTARPPTVAAAQVGYRPTLASSGCERGHWVRSVADRGGVVVLEDGSVWLVSPLDKITTMLWLPVTNVLACDDKLVNLDNGETVQARRAR